MTMPNSDRELLELAARAAGYINPTDDDDIWMHAESGELHQWNPLEDDSDAFGLMVKLGIDVEHNKDWVCARKQPQAAIYQQIDDDRDHATRRAITRAAAEIGKALKDPQ